MGRICCIGLSFAARIIGTCGLSASILILNMSLSYFFSRKDDKEFFEAIETWSLLGLNWVQTLKYVPFENSAQITMICLLVYIVSFTFANGYLAVGSMARKPKTAVPWMYLQMISIIDQSMALVVHLTHRPHYDVYDRSIWYIPVSSVYLLLCVYFWMVVHAARWEWVNEPQNCQELGPELVISSRPSSGEGGNEVLKSPSFLAQNFAMFTISTQLPKQNP